MTQGRGFKSDRAARDAWGVAYDAIPKSAFALVAFHLANLCAEEADYTPSIMARFQEESYALYINGILPEEHAKAIRAAIAKAGGAS